MVTLPRRNLRQRLAIGRMKFSPTHGCPLASDRDLILRLLKRDINRRSLSCSRYRTRRPRDCFANANVCDLILADGIVEDVEHQFLNKFNRLGLAAIRP